ncbi:tetratricopeptide repeat protein [bacterium]|nr:tetratricopeptide repeat protein [bacterium]
MDYNFLREDLDKNDLSSQTAVDIDKILLQNNTDQIKKLYNFYENKNNLLFVNGFLGTGKFEVVNYTTSFLSDETVVLRYNCFNATVLDDILLAFFKDLKNLVLQKKITPPKIKTENFTQKINSYFSHVEKPFVIILNSFESILDENRQEICDFIMHLTTIEKVKVIVIGRSFDSKAFPDKTVDRVTMYALDKPLVEKYFKENSIKISNSELDEFYKLSRGYYFYVILAINLIKHNKLTTKDFFDGLKNSFLTFDKFLLKQSLTLVPTIKINLFWFLVLIRHEITVDLLKIFDFYNEDALNQLVENSIVTKDGENLYISDFFDDITEIAPVSLIHKMRFFLISLYQSQLPLKPLERNICISRQTMRKEIEYHKIFLPKTYKPNTIEMQQISSNVEVDKETVDLPVQEPEQNAILPTEVTPEEETKDTIGKVDIENVLLKLDKVQEPEIEENLSFRETLERLNDAHKNYNYNLVIEYAKRALEMKTEPDYNKYVPILYERSAFAFKKLAKYDKSLEYYEYVGKIYEKLNLHEKISTVRYNIADIYYETYKVQKAKQIFDEIVNNPKSPKNLIVASYLRLASIEEDTNSQSPNIAQYYKNAISISSEVTNKKVLAELYFRLALLMDEKNELEKAKEFYGKCMEISDGKVNSFLSSACSNLATIYLDDGNEEKAVELYTEAYKIDLDNSNAEGVYDSASKIALIFKRRNPQKALNYFTIALEASKHNSDKFYTVSSYLELGDFYYENKDDENALINYLNALDLAKINLTKDNVSKINIRINDVKYRLGDAKYNQLLEKVEEKRKLENLNAKKS